jgi:hypothetical protein
MTKKDLEEIKEVNKANIESLFENGRTRLLWGRNVALIGDGHKQSHQEYVLDARGPLAQSGFLTKGARIKMKRRYSAPNNLKNRTEFEDLWMRTKKVLYDEQPAASVLLDLNGNVVVQEESDFLEECRLQ